MLKKIVILLIGVGIIASASFYYIDKKNKKQQVTFEQNQAAPVPVVVAPKLAPIITTDLYQTFELANGMHVFVIPNHSIPAVSHMVWYRVGAKDEVVGKSGLAHLQEHLMFKGTDKYPKGEFSKVVAQYGGQENAFTGQDYTAFFQKVPTEQLELMMQMEADRMKNLNFNDQEFQTERNVVMEEFRMTMKNKPRSLMLQELDAALYRNHPYRKQIIGWEDELKALTRDDAYAFHKKYYDPANAILVISGDIDAKTVQPLAEKYYGVIPSNYYEDRQPISEPERVAFTKVVYEDERVEQQEFWQKFIAPSYTDKNKDKVKEAYALEVLARLLGGGTSSILYKSLVVEQKLASSAGADFSGFNFGPSEVILFAYPQPGVGADAIQAAMAVEVEKVQSGGIDAERLEATKKAMIAEQIYDQEGLQQIAYKVAQNYIIGLSPDFSKEWEKGIKAVTKDDIVTAAIDVLQTQKSAVGILQSVPKAAEPVEAATAKTDAKQAVKKPVAEKPKAKEKK